MRWLDLCLGRGRELSKTGKAQLASVVADIVKRMAASAAEADSDVGDSNR
jgi:hypothetical protein